MRVRQIFTDSPRRNFTYLIESDDGSRVYNIDPYDVRQVAELLDPDRRRVTHIVNTHEHGDHTQGNAGVVARYQCAVLAHPGCRGRAPHQSADLADGELLPIEAGRALRAVYTPGHTFAHVSFLLEDGGRTTAIFSGDTLFNAGVGNCRLGGEPGALFETIQTHFARLADEVRVYPGHEYMGTNLRFFLSLLPDHADARQLLARYERGAAQGDYFLDSTIGLERSINAFLQLDSAPLRAAVAARPEAGLRDDSPRELFLALRRLRDAWQDPA
jgi:hydroxyacylglutathione hydrolase